MTSETKTESMCNCCSYKKECIKENGDEREDGDDYRAIEGTHLCRKSWDKHIERLKIR